MWNDRRTLSNKYKRTHKIIHYTLLVKTDSGDKNFLILDIKRGELKYAANIASIGI